jgi:hypothetical protein
MTTRTPVLSTAFRVLTFRARTSDYEGLDGRHLVFGLACAWLAGIGRYWDNPRVEGVQKLGLGSVAYVLALSLLLFVLVRPLRPDRWTYRRTAAFVALTAPPALIYAVPVERLYPLDRARAINVAFLLVVASWRVALYGHFLRRSARLRWASLLAALLAPLTIIVVALVLLNLERAVFDLMAGIRDDGTASDEAYATLIALGFYSVAASPLVAVLWISEVVLARRRRPRAA